jgi:hypothetical protein
MCLKRVPPRLENRSEFTCNLVIHQREIYCRSSGNVENLINSLRELGSMLRDSGCKIKARETIFIDPEPIYTYARRLSQVICQRPQDRWPRTKRGLHEAAVVAFVFRFPLTSSQWPNCNEQRGNPGAINIHIISHTPMRYSIRG